MQYLCRKQISIGGRTYTPGEVIPDGVVLDERADRLKMCKYIAEIKDEVPAELVPSASVEFTEPENTVVFIEVGEPESEEKVSIPATPEEIQQVFAILQMNAEDGVKAISDVKDENVLILIHASDSRTTVKKAAEKQAGTLTTHETVSNGADNGKQPTDDN